MEKASLSRLLFALDYRSKDISASYLTAQTAASPSRRFFYLDRLTAPDLELQFGGTLLSSNAVLSEAPRDGSEGDAAGNDFRPPWEAGGENDRSSSTDSGPRPPEFPLRERLPDLVRPVGYGLSYTFTPRLLVEEKTASSPWTRPEDIGYNFASRTISAQYSGQLAIRPELPGRSGQDAYHPGCGGHLPHLRCSWRRLTATEVDTGVQDAYKNRTHAVTGGFTASTRPLEDSETWKSSYLSYTFQTTIFRSSLRDVSGGDPHYANEWLGWDTRFVSSHNADLYVQAATPWITPSLRFSYVLPPLNDRATATAAAITGPLTSSVSFDAQKTSTGWVRLPMTFANSLKSGSMLEATSSLIYDPDPAIFRSWTASLHLGIVKATYLARYTEDYDFVPGSGWVPSGRLAFIPQQFTMNAAYTYQSDPVWRNRVRWSVGALSDYTMDLDRFTESTLVFGLEFGLQVHRFLELKLETASRNTQVYRYIPPLAAVIGVPWINPMTDILRSFNFGSDKEREEARFKLASVSFEAIHHLDDWDLSVKYSGKPELKTLASGAKEFRWMPLLTILLAWKPIPEIKSEI
ncbi:MAG: hypothetical protein HC888_18340, partial [Candidatus Competibacteraceae bacterium]|nr:hypothetical protein [Candidatus Competibacteraceae bacterium]